MEYFTEKTSEDIAEAAVEQTNNEKRMRRTYSHCGFAMLTLMLLFAVLFPALMKLLSLSEPLYDHVRPFLIKNWFYFNEVIVALILLGGAILLLRLPASPPEPQKVSFKFFIVLFTVSIAFSVVGNIISKFWSNLWLLFTGIDTQDAIGSASIDTDIWQTIICVGILAPIIEEYFFRKLLIDRLYPFSETIAILTSAIFFALFHQNIHQFFYALAGGLILSYLYVRSGSYRLAVLFHMAFNLFCSVIPTILQKNIEQAEAVLSTGGELTLPQTAGYNICVLLNTIHTYAYLGALVLGIVFFFVHAKRIELHKSDFPLTPEAKVRASVKNVGMILGLTASVALLVYSMFP